MKTAYSFDPRRRSQSRLYRPSPLCQKGWRTRLNWFEELKQKVPAGKK